MRLGRICLVVLAVALLPTERARAQWRTTSNADQMSGEVTRHAMSPMVGPNRRMSFPYGDTRAWVGVGCSSDGRYWAYLGFSNEPNLTTAEPQAGGYSTVSLRVRWDDDLTTEDFTQTWGDRFLSFARDEEAVRRLKDAASVFVELPWYGDGGVVFRFPLAGSSAAIDRQLSACGIAPSTPMAAPDPALVAGAQWIADDLVNRYYPRECGLTRVAADRRRYFMTEAEAQAAGFRRSTVC